MSAQIKIFRSPNFEYSSYISNHALLTDGQKHHNHAAFRNFQDTKASILKIGRMIDEKRQAARFSAGPMTLAETVWDAHMEGLVEKSGKWLAEVYAVDEAMAYWILVRPLTGLCSVIGK
ncbi:MAG: hypothetical protein Q9207_003082 [Kuettlingeria erythrocarpa]